MIFFFFRPSNGPLVQKLDQMQGAQEVWRDLRKNLNIEDWAVTFGFWLRHLQIAQQLPQPNRSW